MVRLEVENRLRATFLTCGLDVLGTRLLSDIFVKGKMGFGRRENWKAVYYCVIEDIERMPLGIGD